MRNTERQRSLERQFGKTGGRDYCQFCEFNKFKIMSFNQYNQPALQFYCEKAQSDTSGYENSYCAKAYNRMVRNRNAK